jgi:hypothetical protein
LAPPAPRTIALQRWEKRWQNAAKKRQVLVRDVVFFLEHEPQTALNRRLLARRYALMR